MEWCSISPPKRIPREVEINLPVSKSIYNRLLIIQALSKEDFIPNYEGLPLDCAELKGALKSAVDGEKHIDTGEGGTSFRFLLSYLAITAYEGTIVARGSMSERPIAPLLSALHTIGAQISFASSSSKALLRMESRKLNGGKLTMDCSVSSQFISALLLIGPYLPGGLQIQCIGDIVSKPYIELTLRLMQSFGVRAYWDETKLVVPQGTYRYDHTGSFQVERDWTSASYFWLHGIALGVSTLRFPGLRVDSMQGDSILSKWTQLQGMLSSFQSDGWSLRQTQRTKPYFGLLFDGKGHPDLAMTHIALYAFHGLSLEYSGLSTWFSKESHRSEAMRREWGKAGVPINWDKKGNVWTDGCTPYSAGKTILIDSHSDHRIAMCLSVLAAKKKVRINNPDVVDKSFPNFWSELTKLGYVIEFDRSSL
ncbi:MAG: hypothetical protein GVX96_04625 [Bacteroidetes bacterium]|nr:hypothetical protein [Bacteroidota bacterium]